jgi:hypothetical protein
MARLLVHVEGQSEEAFVNEILREYLLGKGFSFLAQELLAIPGYADSGAASGHG